MVRDNMARQDEGITARAVRTSRFGLLLGTAIAGLALAGCTASAPPAQVSISKAQSALEDGKVDKAIAHGEAAVLAEPRDASYRAVLGAAYLEAGRFQSAATTFGDAIELGDSQPRTLLSYALALAAVGDNAEAVTVLKANQNVIPSADLGLALALAGQPSEGVRTLIRAIRNGGADAKTRQNLAYAYALDGNWRAARVMAAEDVPVDQLNARLTQWAENVRPEDHLQRVAQLLAVQPTADMGQPQHLALGNFPSQPTLVAEAEQQASEAEVLIAAAPRESEVMVFAIGAEDTRDNAVESVDPTSVAASSPATAAAPAPKAKSSGPRFVSNAVVQTVPERAKSKAAPTAAAKPAPTRVAAASQQRMAVATGSAATHLVQLGSFDSPEVAQAKWNDFKRRIPALAAHDIVITEAEVNGRTFFRLAAAGFGARSARAMCSSVKSAGRGCFAYAATNPPAGAVKRGVRVAAASR
ncbi:tetratricopeptide repeat protein [Erythrobacter sp.]|jgi:Flp pilus assembly protein TadD|uniref:tetratricopeptide repeat protein n=1 Tax=Erythrobacter sp. TaxID=1042 RepID=UPI002EB24533|nr:SPOR domain-containing protein [Erythrobacter sp.]